MDFLHSTRRREELGEILIWGSQHFPARRAGCATQPGNAVREALVQGADLPRTLIKNGCASKQPGHPFLIY